MPKKKENRIRNAENDESRGIGSALASLWGFIAWLTGVIVSLAVGFGLVSGTLEIPGLSDIFNGLITQTAGWILVVLSLLGVVLKIIDIFNK